MPPVLLFVPNGRGERARVDRLFEFSGNHDAWREDANGRCCHLRELVRRDSRALAQRLEATPRRTGSPPREECSEGARRCPAPEVPNRPARRGRWRPAAAASRSRASRPARDRGRSSSRTIGAVRRRQAVTAGRCPGPRATPAEAHGPRRDLRRASTWRAISSSRAGSIDSTASTRVAMAGVTSGRRIRFSASITRARSTTLRLNAGVYTNALPVRSRVTSPFA